MNMEEMTTTEVEAALKDCQTVIIPFGVMEAHGDHLPLATDTIQAHEAALCAARLTPVFVIPPVPYGMCRSAAQHPGTIGITGETLRALTRDIVTSLHRTGMRNFILYSGHASGIQLASMEEACESLMQRFDDINLAVVSEFDVIKKHATDAIEVPTDLHAGEIETSRMMFLRPHLVRRDKLPDETYRTSTKPILVRNTRRYWEGSTDGAPQRASVEKGEIFAQVTGEYLADLVKRMASFDPH